MQMSNIQCIFIATTPHRMVWVCTRACVHGMSRRTAHPQASSVEFCRCSQSFLSARSVEGAFRAAAILFTSAKNKNGPKTELWGTSEDAMATDESLGRIRLDLFRLDRHCLISNMSCSQTLYLCYFDWSSRSFRESDRTWHKFSITEK